MSANDAWNLVNFRAGLIAALIAAGYRVVALAPANPAMEQALIALGCSFEAIPIDSAGVSPARDWKTLAAYRRLLRRLRPAALLSWTIKPNVYGALAARTCGVAAFPNVSGLGTAFIRRSPLTYLVQALYRAGFAGARMVFFQNRDDRELFTTRHLVRPGQARLLPGSGIDTARFAPAADDRRPAARRFTMIARLLADKGVREFVAAAQIVRRSWPDARFVLIGFLDVANRTAISKDEVACWIAAGTIEYVAPLDDVRPAIAAADFIVLPSYREGLSRVLLEAAAMARPIVTTDVPGCRDVVRDGENGYLCAPRDAAALAQALLRACAADDAEWARMAAAGRARAVGEFAQEAVISQYFAALGEAGIVVPARPETLPELVPKILPEILPETLPKTSVES